MSILTRILGSSEKTQTAILTGGISQQASSLISAALEIIEAEAKIEKAFVQVATGSNSKVMVAARQLESAYRLHPQNPLLHYAWASALHLAAQFKSAEDEMKKVYQAHPRFMLAKFAVEEWETWKSPFTLPSLKPDSQSVHPAISAAVKTCILVATRDRLVPRATLFLRDVAGDFQNIEALKAAKIDLTTVISPIKNPQVIGIYGRIWDDPQNPYGIETLDVPLRPKGDMTRRKYEFLCTQQYIDFVIINKQDRILVTKRITMSDNMQDTNKKLLKMLESTAGQEVSTSEVVNAVTSHQRQFPTSSVQY